MAPTRRTTQETSSASSGDPVAATLEDLKKLVETYGGCFDRLEGLIEGYKKEVKKLNEELVELKKTLADRDKELYGCKERQNEQEQYVRGWSIRVLNLAIPEEEVSEPVKVMQHVHNRLLLPIFKGAKERGLLQSIPSADAVLETAHILPAKEGAVPAIICRFYSRNIRAIVFRLRKDFAPRQLPERGEQSRPGRFQHPFYEDLTRPNFHKLRALSQHDRVQSCWTVNGVIKYKLKDEEAVRKVKTVFATVEDILK